MICETEGDIGDAVIQLGVIEQIPNGPHTYVVQTSGCTKFRTPKDADRLCSIIKPLAELQPYIKECRRVIEGEHIDWHDGIFRSNGFVAGRSLFTAHCTGLMQAKGIGDGFLCDHPFLTVDEIDQKSVGRVIISRSGRYRNNTFPWMEICRKYGNRLLFVGLEHEWRDFSGEFQSVEFAKTENMLEVARLIKGSLLFIGNQSSPMAVCEGLKHRSIQETSLNTPDCIYKRDNAQYCYNGSCILPGFDGDDDTIIPVPPMTKDKISTSQSPPGGWKYPGIPSTFSFESCISMAMQLPYFRQLNRDEVEAKVIEHITSENWEYFVNPDAEFFVAMALESAGYSKK